ncbi:hypothetical protein LOTGIDRAFT_154859 [Lottia gigantea]|uniref:Uncharacterized protein n=1 Tax=Lottia gigantea TaxID=225164 RepID=V3ZWR2_LOTGI|nr:hypothetical protein LOTGIDRAFT_154859 [Lottia gigantea]ESO85366.1 hypothetical protein LOTGIDRAFT_154859 [Lottia gigantea]
MSNMIYDGQQIVNLIEKAKATKDRHTIKEHSLMLDQSAAVKSGSLVNIDVFRRLLHLQAMRRDGINFNYLGRPLIDNTIDILNRMKLGSQYPKLAFEILDGQSLLDIMSAHQPSKQQMPKKNPEIGATQKLNNTGKSKNLNTSRIKSSDNKIHGDNENPSPINKNRQKLVSLYSIDGEHNSKFNSPNENNVQYPFDQSENMIVDYPIKKPMKTGRNLLDADYLDQNDGIQQQVSVDIGTRNNLETTTGNPVNHTHTLGQQTLLDTATQDRSPMVTRLKDQSQNDSDIQRSLPKDTKDLGQVFVTENQGTTVSGTNHTIITGGGNVLTSTPVDTSMNEVVIPENYINVDPTIVGNTDFMLQTEIETFIQNTSALMTGQLATQLEAPTDTVSLTISSATPSTKPIRLALTSQMKSVRSNTTAQDTSLSSHPTSEVTEQATKYHSLPTTQENLTTNRVTTTVSSDFDWCTFLCNVMKRCSPACSGHFTSWNR